MTERPIFFEDQEEIVLLARAAGWDACTFDTAENVTRHPRLRALFSQSALLFASAKASGTVNVLERLQQAEGK